MKQSSARLITGVVVLAVIIVAVAAIYATTASNSANSATNKPDHIDWAGAVCDVNHVPMGDVTVTLCLMTPTGEAYNVTNRTLTGTMWPGSYTFLNVPVRDDVTYAYAYAVSDDLGDGVRLIGCTNDLEINKSRIISGFIIMHAPGSGNNAQPGDNSSDRVLQGWFGSVTDGSGKALGGITVTLHLMTPDGEAATNTTQTISTGPYPGSFVFDSVRLPDNVTYGYVTAESSDPGDGVRHTARSGNYTFEKPRISSGILVL